MKKILIAAISLPIITMAMTSKKTESNTTDTDTITIKQLVDTTKQL